MIFGASPAGHANADGPEPDTLYKVVKVVDRGKDGNRVLFIARQAEQASSRNRVLRGTGVTQTAKRTQGVCRPCH